MIKRRFIVIFLLIITLTVFVSAEKLEISTSNSYYPGDNAKFKIILYDDQNNQIQGEIKFQIQNYYEEIIEEGTINSGEEINFQLPENSIRGHWGIIAIYNELEKKELFNVLELEKANIRLEEDKLIITNIGNVLYRKSLQIEIGDHKETALVPLGIGETKEIKLTAPDGTYDIKVSDGTEEELTFQGVSLTGNVIGLENASEKGFFIENPLISLFLMVIIIAAIISGLKFFKKKPKK